MRRSFFFAVILLAFSTVVAFAQLEMGSGLNGQDTRSGGLEAGVGLLVSNTTVSGGPCDLTTCAAAVSMTHALKGNYNGNLFQLYNGTTTLNVGVVAAGGAVNMSGIPAFCKGVTNSCVVSGVYDQISGTMIVPVNSTKSALNPPAACGSGTGNVCAAPFLLDPKTGLPVLVTVFPTEYDTQLVGITGTSASPTSVYWFGRDELFPGEFGVGHISSQGLPLTNGTDFLSSIYYGTHAVVNNYIVCSAGTQACAFDDEETSAGPFTNATKPGAIGASYGTAGTAVGDIHAMITYDGGGSTGTVTYYLNSATALTNSHPPSSYQDSTSLLTPNNFLKIGCGGDCTQSNIIFRDGIVTNSTLSSSDYTNITNNETSFYSGHASASSCHAVADLGFQTAYNGLNQYANFAIYTNPLVGLADYSLAQVRAGYFGPVATLNNGTTTQNFTGAIAAGSAGCGLDPAANTFCTAGAFGHCTVAALFNQGTWNTSGVGNVYDTSMTISFGAGAQPTVTFNSLNGLPTMNFSGSQFGCTTNTTAAYVGYTAFGAVARRTGATTSFASVVDWNENGNNGGGAGSTQQQLGFNNTVNTVFYYSFPNLTTVTANDSQWHSLYTENNNGTFTPFTNGVSGATYTSTSGPVSTQLCIGGQVGPAEELVGDIAQVDLINLQTQTTAGFTSEASSVFSALEGAWGTLPH